MDGERSHVGSVDWGVIHVKCVEYSHVHVVFHRDRGGPPSPTFSGCKPQGWLLIAMEWKSACAEILVGNDSMISLVLCNSTMYGRAVSRRKMIYIGASFCSSLTLYSSYKKLMRPLLYDCSSFWLRSIGIWI